MNSKQRFLSQVLLITFIFQFIAMLSVNATAISASEMAQKFDALKKSYQDKTYWNEVYNGAQQCMGFALLVDDYLFGEDARSLNWVVHGDVSQLHVGDHVRFNNISCDHSIVVSNIVGDTVYYVDCNGNSDNLVYWRSTTKQQIAAWIARYPLFDGNQRRGGYGYIQSQPQNNVVSLNYPSKPVLGFDQSNNPIYAIPKAQETANVKFSWDQTDNTICYDLKLYDWNSNLVQDIIGIHNTNTWAIDLPKGNYSAVLFARNDVAQTEGNWVTFQVVEEPQIQTDKNIYISGENITVSWGLMNYAEAFDLKVYDWGTPASLKYSAIGIHNKNFWTFTLPTGNYTVVLTPKNQYGSVVSNWVPFQVLASATVTFDSQGGNVVASKTANYNAIITEPLAPTKHGAIFAGWYKEESCINAWDFAVDKATSDTTLYAKWVMPFSVSAIYSVDNGMLNVDATIKNNSAEQTTASVIIATYENANKLRNIKIVSDSYSAGAQKTVHYTYACDNMSDKYFKVFVFEDLTVYNPLAMPYNSNQQ